MPDKINIPIEVPANCLEPGVPVCQFLDPQDGSYYPLCSRFKQHLKESELCGRGRIIIPCGDCLLARIKNTP